MGRFYTEWKMPCPNKKEQMGKQSKKDFHDITWSDLESWAGSKIVSRGRAYQKSKSVTEIALTAAGEIVAWVDGSSTYATRVSLDNGKISSVCTCPYHSACKHAVAAVLEYLNCLENDWKVVKPGKAGMTRNSADKMILMNMSEPDPIIRKEILSSPIEF